MCTAFGVFLLRKFRIFRQPLYWNSQDVDINKPDVIQIHNWNMFIFLYPERLCLWKYPDLRTCLPWPTIWISSCQCLKELLIVLKKLQLQRFHAPAIWQFQVQSIIVGRTEQQWRFSSVAYKSICRRRRRSAKISLCVHSHDEMVELSVKFESFLVYEWQSCCDVCAIDH